MKNGDEAGGLDEFFQLLDAMRIELADFVNGEASPAWATSEARVEVARRKRRYAKFAQRIRARIASIGDSSVVAKAEHLSRALEELVFPEFSEPEDSSRIVNTTWHVVVGCTANRGRKGRADAVGILDYRLYTLPRLPRLDVSGLECALMLAESDQMSLAEWLSRVRVERVIAPGNMRWEYSRGEPIECYVVIDPALASISAQIRRLRPFEEVVGQHRIFICTERKDSSETLISQGFGSINCRTREIRGWSARPVVEDEIRDDDDVDIMFRIWGDDPEL